MFYGLIAWGSNVVQVRACLIRCDAITSRSAIEAYEEFMKAIWHPRIILYRCYSHCTSVVPGLSVQTAVRERTSYQKYLISKAGSSSQASSRVNVATALGLRANGACTMSSLYFTLYFMMKKAAPHAIGQTTQPFSMCRLYMYCHPIRNLLRHLILVAIRLF